MLRVRGFPASCSLARSRKGFTVASFARLARRHDNVLVVIQAAKYASAAS